MIEGEDYLLLVMAFLLGLLVAIPFWGFVDNVDGKIPAEDLANAICEERFDLVFDEFEDGRIKCKQLENIEFETYDGLSVEIG